MWSQRDPTQETAVLQAGLAGRRFGLITQHETQRWADDWVSFPVGWGGSGAAWWAGSWGCSGRSGDGSGPGRLVVLSQKQDS